MVVKIVLLVADLRKTYLRVEESFSDLTLELIPVRQNLKYGLNIAYLKVIGAYFAGVLKSALKILADGEAPHDLAGRPLTRLDRRTVSCG